uniref:Uncharacterized protein n=1 Tax=viral metagenome TaxID=1070528 RepID=A0A6H1Z8C0_9ZZZZ
MAEHHCEEYDKWNKFENGVYGLAFAHGMYYPDDYPRFKFCPFCGEKIEVILKKSRSGG